MLKYLILFIIAAGFSLLLTPLVRSAALRLGAMDVPDGRKIHTCPIPRLGGAAIFITFYIVLFISSQLWFLHFPVGFLREKDFGWILLASAIVLGLGAVDDFRGMSPGVKWRCSSAGRRA